MNEAKLFNRWEMENIKVKDAGLIDYVTVTPIIVPKTGGRHAKHQFHKSKVPIVERLMNKLFVSGHKGKKHKISSGHNVGKTFNAARIVSGAFELIETQTKKNPVEVFVAAVENSAPTEEVMSYQKGGIMAREGVVTSPQRRVDLALKHLAQGTFHKAHKSKKPASRTLADEIMGAYKEDSSASFAFSERVRREKEAAGSL